MPAPANQSIFQGVYETEHYRVERGAKLGRQNFAWLVYERRGRAFAHVATIAATTAQVAIREYEES